MNRQRGAQRGVALLTAMVLVALATVVAVSIAFATALSARRGVASFTVEQGLLLGAGAEGLAASVLMDDATPRLQGGGRQPSTPIDYPGETWTNRYPAVEVAEGVAIEAQIEDESGKFNLNSLVTVDMDGNPVVDAESMAIFKRLLEALSLEDRWAPLVADWIDSDPNPQSDGGEDDVYSSLSPPYRAANQYISSVSELMSLPGFGRERYLKLRPHVAALPPDSRSINLCFATGELLDAILGAYSQSRVQDFSPDPAQLEKNRQGGCFPRKTTFFQSHTAAQGAQAQQLADRTIEQSTFFRLHTWVTIGTTRFALYSLLKRESSGQGNAQVTLLSRTFGTE